MTKLESEINKGLCPSVRIGYRPIPPNDVNLLRQTASGTTWVGRVAKPVGAQPVLSLKVLG
jgi:hypothetical protein